MKRTMVLAFVCSTLLAACSGAKEVKERKHTYSYTQQQKAEARMRIDQRRMDRENYKQIKKMERASSKQNKRGWDANHLGNVFGL